MSTAAIAAIAGLMIFYAIALVYAIGTKGDTGQAGCGLLFCALLFLAVVVVGPHVVVTFR